MLFAEHVRAHNARARRLNLHVLDTDPESFSRPTWTVCLAYLRAHMDAEAMPWAWLALFSALLGVTVRKNPS